MLRTSITETMKNGKTCGKILKIMIFTMGRIVIQCSLADRKNLDRRVICNLLKLRA